MLTDDELLHIVTDCPAGNPRQLLLQVARGVEAKVLAKMHLAYDQGKTCRTCEHLDTDAKQDPCAGCRDFARWVGKPGAARPHGVSVAGHQTFSQNTPMPGGEPQR